VLIWDKCNLRDSTSVVYHFETAQGIVEIPVEFIETLTGVGIVHSCQTTKFMEHGFTITIATTATSHAADFESGHSRLRCGKTLGLFFNVTDVTLD